MNHSDDSGTHEVALLTLEIFGLPIAVIAIFELLNWAGWAWASFGFGIAVYTLVCAILIVVQFIWKEALDVPVLITGGLVLLCVFPYLCETVFDLWGSAAFIADALLTRSDWIWFTVENIGGVLLLDMFDVYGIKLSRIEFNPTFWPSTLVFGFRTALGFGLAPFVVHILVSYSAPYRRTAEESASKSA